MKYMSKILSLLLVAFVAAACEPEAEDYQAAGIVEGEGVYFAPGNTTSYMVEETSGSFTVNVMRSNADAEATVDVTTEYGEGAAEVFSVPSSVSFAAESSETTLTVSYTNLVPDATYTVTLSFADNTPYGNTVSQTFSVRNRIEKWEVVSTNATLIDNLFSAFSLADVPIEGITVEKEASTNQYRFLSPYNNDYFEEYVTGTPDFFGDMEMPYIYLDGETYAGNGYYIPATALGFVMINGVGPEVNATWDTFGSVAGNLSTADGLIEPGNPSYPLGSYDATKKMFDLGACYFNFDYDANGEAYYYPMSEGSFQLWLDPTMMETDYDRDKTTTVTIHGMKYPKQPVSSPQK